MMFVEILNIVSDNISDLLPINDWIRLTYICCKQTKQKFTLQPLLNINTLTYITISLQPWISMKQLRYVLQESQLYHIRYPIKIRTSLTSFNNFIKYATYIELKSIYGGSWEFYSVSSDIFGLYNTKTGHSLIWNKKEIVYCSMCILYKEAWNKLYNLGYTNQLIMRNGTNIYHVIPEYAHKGYTCESMHDEKVHTLLLTLDNERYNAEDCNKLCSYINISKDAVYEHTISKLFIK